MLLVGGSLAAVLFLLVAVPGAIGVAWWLLAADTNTKRTNLAAEPPAPKAGPVSTAPTAEPDGEDDATPLNRGNNSRSDSGKEEAKPVARRR